MPNGDFERRLDRISAKQGAKSYENAGAAAPKASVAQSALSSIWVLAAALLGFAGGTSIQIANTHYEALVRAAETQAAGLNITHYLFIIAVTLLALLVGVIRRLVSKRARSRGWRPVLWLIGGFALAGLFNAVFGPQPLNGASS